MPVITPPPGFALQPLGRWELRTNTISSGLGLDGRQQYIRRENRTWRNRYQVLGAWFDSGQEKYDAFLDQLHGAANTFDLPVPNRWIGSESVPLFVTVDGDFEFDDSGTSMLVLDGSIAPVVAVDAPVRATVLTLSGPDGEAMGIGWVFSVNSFLYRVATNTAGVITFNPPLRAAVTASTVLQVQQPKIRVRLDGDGAAAAAHSFSQMGAPQILNVVEAFER